MKAHIVGGGFGGLAAAAYLIRNAGVSGQDITIYEADERMGGGLFLGGSAETGYNMPASVFDEEFRCAFDLLQTIPSASGSAISVKDEFFTFNTQHPFRDRVHIIDRNGLAVPHAPRFGLSVRDGPARVDARITAGWAAHRGILCPTVLLDPILVALVDNLWVAATAQRDGVSALNEPRPGFVSRLVGPETRPAHARQPTPGVHRTTGRLAAATRRELRGRPSSGISASRRRMAA